MGFNSGFKRLTAIALGFMYRNVSITKAGIFLENILYTPSSIFICFFNIWRMLYMWLLYQLCLDTYWFLQYIRSQRDAIFSFRYVRMSHGALVGALKTWKKKVILNITVFNDVAPINPINVYVVYMYVCMCVCVCVIYCSIIALWPFA